MFCAACFSAPLVKDKSESKGAKPADQISDAVRDTDRRLSSTLSNALVILCTDCANGTT